MGKSLVIVESPAKAKTIARYLGAGFEVRASVGHIKDLPKKKLGVDIKNNFHATFEIIPGKEKVVAGLRKAAREAEKIYLAADPDREGEAICKHLSEEVPGKGQPFYRVMFNEITKDAIKKAFLNPSQINENLVNAQLARRILDRLVGYKISPLLWRKVRRGLSAGRVQSVALRLIVEREKEIRAFVPEEYWTFFAYLEAKVPPVFKAKAIKLDGKKFKICSKDEAEALYAELKGASFVVDDIKKSIRKQRPRPPFITSTLQQEANRRYKFPARKTMKIAQKLYEGVDVGASGRIGLITYMRTDSTRIAQPAIESVRDYIVNEIGREFLPSSPRIYSRSKDAQDAHEAIRPTDIGLTPESLKPYLSSDEFKVYQLIWKRFVASQMKDAHFDHTDVKVTAGRCVFQCIGDVLRFAGYLKLYEEAKDEDSGNKEDRTSMIPPLEKGEVLLLKKLERKQNFTQPPPRYTEASLIKTLEEKGIGRPSTYAQIVFVIQERDYVEKMEGRFHPTQLGEIVTDLLIENFPDLFDYRYTAEMENRLDLIEQGKSKWVEELKNFYLPFSKSLHKAEKEMRDIKSEVVPTDEKCPVCSAPMVIKWGRFGKFLACSRYPECKTTQELPDEGEKNEQEKTCPKCGSKLVLKKGRFGPFLACSMYPECKYTEKVNNYKTKEPDKILDKKCPVCGKSLVEKHGRYGRFIACSGYPECNYIEQNKLKMKCPIEGCDGEIIVRRTRRGKLFYGCSKYPECTFTSWQKPVDLKCPQCGSNYLLEKTSKKKGTFLQCPNAECHYEIVNDSEREDA